MRPSFRALFLILAASFVLHVSLLGTAVLLVGYLIAEREDQWLVTRAREKWIENVMNGWKPCEDDSECEQKGGWARVKLTGRIKLSRLGSVNC
jgi:hypothetical protein